MSDIDEVTAALRHAGRLTEEQIAQATGLSRHAVGLALQALLLRRLVVCSSFTRPGRGGQGARYIGEAWESLWALADDM